jgi:hypothetical protein
VFVCEIHVWVDMCEVTILSYHNPVSNTMVELVIPYGTETIEPYAYQNHGLITSVVIPDTVICIGTFAFDGCTSLETVYIPASVAHIGYPKPYT